MRACFFGTYDPSYPRNIVLRKGLQKNGVEVIECNVSLPQIKISREGKLGLAEFIVKRSLVFSKCYTKLFFKFLRGGRKCDSIIVPFEWEYDVFLAWFFAKLFGKKLVFDIFNSKYATLVLESRVFPEKSFSAEWNLWKDRLSFALSDKVLVQTKTHADSLSKTLKVPKEKMRVLYLGAEEEKFFSRPAKKSKNFNVLFFGSFIPLQGLEYIIGAAEKLKNEKDIRFKLLGKGLLFNEVKAMAEQKSLANVEFLGWVPEENLPEEIASADICLGQFGKTERANIFIGHKIFQSIAMKKPVINADTPAAREFFKENESIVFCKGGNASSLAQKILFLKSNPPLRRSISSNAFRVFRQNFTAEKIGFELKKIIEETKPNK